MRDLVRAREAAHIDYTRNRQQVSSFLLRLGRYYPGKKTWGKAHLKWLAAQKLVNYEQRIAFEELLLAVRQSRERIERLEQAILLAALPNSPETSGLNFRERGVLNLQR